MQNALNEIWKFTEELFDLDDLDQIMIRNGIGVNQSEFKSEWKNLVDKALVEAKLKIPQNTKMISGGKKVNIQVLLQNLYLKCNIFLESILMQNGSVDQVWDILNQVPDPEIPVISIVELGVVRDVKFINDCCIISITYLFWVSCNKNL